MFDVELINQYIQSKDKGLSGLSVTPYIHIFLNY